MFSVLYNKGAAIAMAEFDLVDEMSGHHAKFDRGMVVFGASCLFGLLAVATLTDSAQAAPKFVSCGGAAMLGGAQLNCSHLAPNKPAQLCNFSWSLLLPNNVPEVVSGSFLLPTGSNNATVYQGTGFTGSLTAPIVLCQDQQ
jgi:hypothetical protein